MGILSIEGTKGRKWIINDSSDYQKIEYLIL